MTNKKNAGRFLPKKGPEASGGTTLIDVILRPALSPITQVLRRTSPVETGSCDDSKVGSEDFTEGLLSVLPSLWLLLCFVLILFTV